MIGHFMTDADVGVYRVALQLTSIATFVTMALHTTLYPKVSYWGKQGDLSSVERALARAFTYSLLLAVPVVVGGWLLGERLLYFFYTASATAGRSARDPPARPGGPCLHVPPDDVLKRSRPTARLVPGDCDRGCRKHRAKPSPHTGIRHRQGVGGDARHHDAECRARPSRPLPEHPYPDEPRAVGHIVLAALAMAAVIVVCTFIIPLSNVFVTLGAVGLGGLVYILVLLRLDEGIHDELKDLAGQLGIPWPDAL